MKGEKKFVILYRKTKLALKWKEKTIVIID
jgi:hypothetical protein